MDETTTINYPGQVDLQYLKLISSNGIVVDLNDYLIEFNLFEDIFSNFLSGQVMVSDSNNILSRLPIIGDELLIISFGTPGLDSYFKKLFRVYSVTDQKTINDRNTQTYSLHFCSIEAIFDANLYVYQAFSGKVSTIAQNIFDNYLKNPRFVNFSENTIELNETVQSIFYFNDTSNSVKFISPGWTPSKCLNWLCSKAIPSNVKACDYLFWETTAGFFFSSVEALIKESEESNKIAGEYFYVPPGVLQPSASIPKLFLVQSFEIVNLTDNLENYTNGFYANKLITFDPIKKSYEEFLFDYPSEYDNFKHTEGKLSVPNFSKDTFRNPSNYAKLYSANSKLFSGVRANFPEKMKDIFGSRTSKLNELNNFRINLTVPGRSDLFVGSIIKFNYPSAVAINDSGESGLDPLYSGNYLITAIRHKINYRTHIMVLELVKDSLVKRT